MTSQTSLGYDEPLFKIKFRVVLLGTLLFALFGFVFCIVWTLLYAKVRIIKLGSIVLGNIHFIRDLAS